MSKPSLSSTTVVLFGLPMLAGGMMNMLAGTFFMKYATDTLFLTPTFIGMALFISRWWDAINDPIIGWLNDRSQAKGKRARWIFVSSFFIGLFFYLLWFPPAQYKQVFVIVYLLLFFTAFTAMFVPHYSLAADISYDEQDRNRLFGFRAICEYLGTFAGVAVMLYLSDASTATQKAHLPMGLILLFTIAVSFLTFLRFRNLESKFQASLNFKEFARQFFNNKHALVVISAGLFSQLGASFVFALTLYFSQYVLLNAETGNYVIGIFLLFAMLGVPLWIFLLTKFEKKYLWILSNVVISAVFAVTFWIQPENLFYMYPVAAVGGFFAGAILTIHPSALADTIDYDESVFQKNNSATYFSLFTFVNKSAMGLASIVVGGLLSYGGYVANSVQSETSIFTIRFSYAFFPALIFLTASTILAFYKLDKKTHEQIKNKLEQMSGS